MKKQETELSVNKRGDVIRACQISTVGINIRSFFRGQFTFLQERGFHYTVITSEPTSADLDIPRETRYYSVPLTRSASPWTDICSIWKLMAIIRKHRFDLVQYTTPKGALLGSIAAILARAPVRLYLMWGIYYVTLTGFKRRLFKALDWLACHLSTHVTFDGFDIRSLAISEGLCSSDKSSVVGEGSDNGIDLIAYDPIVLADPGRAVRREFGIPDDALVIGSVMRLVGDKGINELVEAFDQIAADNDKVWLFLIAEEEQRDRPRPETLNIMTIHPRIVRIDFQSNIRPHFAAMDIFCLPTYREGFSAVNLEAAAMALPVVTTDAVGAKETIVDGETGFAVPVKNVGELAVELNKLIENPKLREQMGKAGRRRVEQHFEQKRFWVALRRHREGLLIARGLYRRDGDTMRRT